jgi:hypothetical protein
MNVAPPAWALWVVGLVEAVALVGLLLAAARGRRSTEGSRLSHTAGHWSLLALPALALAWIVSFAITAGLVAWQGRLLFPALPAIAILLARGLSVASSQWSVALGRQIRRYGPRTTDQRLRAIALLLALCPLFALALWMPENVIRPAYPRQTLPEATAQERLSNPLIVRFRRRGESSITLRGWRVDEPAQAGAALDLTLMWYASSRQVRDWVVFVHLIDREGKVVAGADSQPRGGAFPTSQWHSGDWVEDRHQIPLPGDLAEGRYTLQMGLYDPSQDSRRAGVYKLGGDLIGDALDLGSVLLQKT